VPQQNVGIDRGTIGSCWQPVMIVESDVPKCQLAIKLAYLHVGRQLL